jgi:diacylglycerol kinase (ATP)
MHKHAISFKHAGQGIWTAIQTQTNLRIHFIAAAIIFLLSVFYHLSHTDILVLVLTVMVVIFAEMVNTAIEFLADAVTLEHDPFIKQAKDVAAGGVLISAIFALLIGLLIFGSKII